jgi:ABC-2 type transport system ATP-binding protein
MTNAITLENVTKTYRVPSVIPFRKAKITQALRDVNLFCPENQITCLLGPNGAGKTTIIKILAGLVLPDAGNVSAAGVSLMNAPIAFRTRIGLVTPNERSFYWRLTGRQNLDFYAALYGMQTKERKQRISEVLAGVELDEEADKPFRLYSAGMKQKLLLSRALLGKPEILLLDEPTSHLDPLAKKNIHRIIKERIKGTGKTSVLLCTHDLPEAQQLADHIILLNEGIVLAEGSLPSLRARVQQHYVVDLEFEKYPVAGWDEDLPATLISREDYKVELKVNDMASIPKIVEAFVNKGGKLISCRRQEESLSDIFSRII